VGDAAASKDLRVGPDAPDWRLGRRRSCESSYTIRSDRWQTASARVRDMVGQRDPKGMPPAEPRILERSTIWRRSSIRQLLRRGARAIVRGLSSSEPSDVILMVGPFGASWVPKYRDDDSPDPERPPIRYVP